MDFVWVPYFANYISDPLNVLFQAPSHVEHHHELGSKENEVRQFAYWLIHGILVVFLRDVSYEFRLGPLLYTICLI
jgi:hypothetical protein